MSTHRNASTAPLAARGLFLLSLLPLAAAAQTNLDPVIVTGTREPERLSQSTADVVVISAETIRDSSATSVEELLRREANIQIAQNGGPGQSSGYFIRGANTNGTVVLIDGVRVGSASLGQMEFEALSLGQVDHIEVLRGPASSLYGADAVGGVIQIFTKKGDGPPHVTGNVAVGGYVSKQANIGVSGASNGIDYAVTAGRDSSQGVSAIRPNDVYGFYNPDDDGYIREYGSVRLGYSPAAGQRIGLNVMESRLNAQYDSADYDAQFNTDPNYDFRNHETTRVMSLDYRGEISPLWTTTAQLSQNLDYSGSGDTPLTLVHFNTTRDQVTWQNALHFGANQQLVLGYEYLYEKVQSEDFIGVPNRNNNAFIAGYSGTFGKSVLEASVRHDANSAYGGNTSGNLGYSYQLVPSLKLRALVGTTYRAPTFNDLYYPEYGIPTIKPERGRSIEVGANWQSGATTASATVYHNKVSDLIQYDPDPTGKDCPPGYFGCAANVSRATLQGVTLSGSQSWGGLRLHGTIDFLSAKDDTTGERLTLRAAHQESVGLDYAVGAWTTGADILDVGKRPDDGVDLGDYAVLNLKAAWRFQPQWRLEAKILNAMNHRVEPVRDYQGLGRQAWIGLRYDGVGL